MLSTSVLIVLPHLQLGRKEQQQTLNKSLPFSDAPDNKMICPSLLPLLAIDLSNLEEYKNSFPLWKAACGPGPYVYHEASAEEESKSPFNKTFRRGHGNWDLCLIYAYYFCSTSVIHVIQKDENHSPVLLLVFDYKALSLTRSIHTASHWKFRYVVCLL